MSTPSPQPGSPKTDHIKPDITSDESSSKRQKTESGFKLPATTVGMSTIFLSRPPPQCALGMFTYGFCDQYDGLWHYKDCKFLVDIEGVVKTGEVLDEVRFSTRFNKLSICKDNKAYTMKIGYFCYGLDVCQDM